MTQDDDGAGIGRNHLADQLQQSLLQRLQVTDGIYRVSDLEERVQIASHPPDIGALGHRRVRSHVCCRQQAVRLVLVLELYRLENQSFVLSDQEDQLASADAERVAVSQQLAAYRDTVYEGAIVAFQIDEMKRSIAFADGEVTPRYRAVAQAKIVGGVATDRKLVARKPHNRALRGPRNYYHARVQNYLP